MKKDRNFNNQVKGTVSVGLWVLYIIFSPDERDIILFKQSFCQHINVGDKGAYDPHAGNVIDALFQILGIQGYIPGRSFLKNALGLLETGFYCLNRIMVALQGQLLTQDFEFCLYFHHGTAIICH